MAKLKTPFIDFLPPLTTEELAALKASIRVDGIHDPIAVDEEGNILDGHHRYKIDKDAPTRTIKGLTDAEKKAYVYQSNLLRRNLTPSQKKAMAKPLKQLAAELRTEGKTQKQIGDMMGVTRQSVALWLAKKNKGTNASTCDTSDHHDCRVKIPAKAKGTIAARVASGETLKQVAADYGVTPKTASNIVKQETKQTEAKERVKAAVKKLGGDTVGIRHGDFRKIGDTIAGASVDMIFTDPPYDKQSVPLYGALAGLATRVLKPGGWCLAYTGQQFLPLVLDTMRQHLIYGWTFCILHSGGDLRFRKYHLRNKWKPIVGFYKPPLNAWWDWFPDIASGGKEKDDHVWQQAMAEAEHFIRHLSMEGSVVLDPMCGSGTSCLAAKNEGRQWIGMDIDKDTVQIARVKLT